MGTCTEQKIPKNQIKGENMSGPILTPTFRVSYPNVFKPKLNELSKKEEYSVVALFKKGEDLSVLQKEIERVAADKWGPGSFSKLESGEIRYTPTGKSPFKIRLPLRDQSERANEKGLPAGYEAGAKFMNLKSNQRPPLIDQKRQDIIDSTAFYAGCYARAAVNAFAYDQAGNKGISLGLQALQKVSDGDPLVNKINPQTFFEAVEEINPQTDASSLFS